MFTHSKQSSLHSNYSPAGSLQDVCKHFKIFIKRPPVTKIKKLKKNPSFCATVVLAFACPNSKVQRFLGLGDPWHLLSSIQIPPSLKCNLALEQTHFFPELLHKWPSTDFYWTQKSFLPSLLHICMWKKAFLTLQMVIASLVMKKIMPFEPLHCTLSSSMSVCT